MRVIFHLHNPVSLGSLGRSQNRGVFGLGLIKLRIDKNEPSTNPLAEAAGNAVTQPDLLPEYRLLDKISQADRHRVRTRLPGEVSRRDHWCRSARYADESQAATGIEPVVDAARGSAQFRAVSHTRPTRSHAFTPFSLAPRACKRHCMPRSLMIGARSWQFGKGSKGRGPPKGRCQI